MNIAGITYDIELAYDTGHLTLIERVVPVESAMDHRIELLNKGYEVKKLGEGGIYEFIDK